MRESYIESKVRKAAILAGWYCRKFTSPGNRGVPDRLFIRNGRVVFIEFKAPGKKPSMLQEREITLLRDQGVEAYVVDSIDAGRKILGMD